MNEWWQCGWWWVTCLVWAWTPPSTNCPLAGSIPSCPEMYIVRSTTTAWLCEENTENHPHWKKCVESELVFLSSAMFYCYRRAEKNFPKLNNKNVFVFVFNYVLCIFYMTAPLFSFINSQSSCGFTTTVITANLGGQIMDFKYIMNCNEFSG